LLLEHFIETVKAAGRSDMLIVGNMVPDENPKCILNMKLEKKWQKNESGFPKSAMCMFPEPQHIQ